MKQIKNKNSHLICVAPMMDYTDRHARFFLRLISSDVRLYTEMITAHALIHGDVAYLLAFDPAEHPLALQLGGSEPAMLKKAARFGQEWGYDEINLNVGCPSDRVRSGAFGACLMLKPQVVAECVSEMQKEVNIPVTVKCRIGVDNHDSYASLHNFIATVASTGCKIFIIHARKAWLSGLSPKQNRDIPPLKYAVVRQIKQDFPNLTIVINGGIQTVNEVAEHLISVDGVMLGRAAYHNPYLLFDIQNHFFANKVMATRQQIIKLFLSYVEQQLQNGVKLSSLTRHILGLFQGQRGAASWRRYLSQHACKPKAGVEVIRNALLELENTRQLCQNC